MHGSVALIFRMSNGRKASTFFQDFQIKKQRFQLSGSTQNQQKMDHKFCVLFTLITLLTVTDYTEANNLVAYYSAAASTVLIAAAAVIFKVKFNCYRQLQHLTVKDHCSTVSWSKIGFEHLCPTMC